MAGNYQDGTGSHSLSAPTLDSAGNLVPLAGVGFDASGISAPVTGTNPLPVAVSDTAGNPNIGTAADTAWSGSGNGTVIAVLKKIWSAITGTLVAQTAGSVGTDASANAASVPGSFLLSTKAVNAARNELLVQNQSTYLIQLVLDDGTGANLTSLFLAPAVVIANGQPIGALISLGPFRGRLRVFCPQVSTAMVAVREH